MPHHRWSDGSGGPATAGRATFGDLCRQHGTAVHAFLARRAGRQTADDLFGEVWLRAYSARAGYDDTLGGPLPWIFGIARNVLREHWRRQHRHQAIAQGTTTDPWDDADDRLAAAVQLDDLRHALGRLTPDEREVLLLVAWEHLTPAEAARVLGIPQGTARSRLHRARHLMQAEMDSPRLIATTTTTEDNR